jgi:hypothetical protein
MDNKHVIVNMRNNLCFEEQDQRYFDERNFLICRSCFWCASYINKMSSVLACPSCKDVKIESMPISFDETYRLDYDTKRGVTLEFARTR